MSSRAERRLIDVTDMETPTDAPATDKRADEGPISERPPTKKKGGGNKVGEFVRQNPRLLAALALLVAGIVFVILGWYGAAYTNILTEQIPYLISGGLLGAALIIVAGFLASSASLERENRELRRDLVRAIGSMPSGDGQVFVVPGGQSFHVAGCPLVEGKSSTTLPLRKAIDQGYAACKLCGND